MPFHPGLTGQPAVILEAEWMDRVLPALQQNRPPALHVFRALQTAVLYLVAPLETMLLTSGFRICCKPRVGFATDYPFLPASLQSESRQGGS